MELTEEKIKRMMKCEKRWEEYFEEIKSDGLEQLIEREKNKSLKAITCPV